MQPDHPVVQFVDTHCHIHELAQALTPTHEKWFTDKVERTPLTVIGAAHDEGIMKMICIGTTLADSMLAVDFVREHERVWASVGIHPHEAAAHNNATSKRDLSHLLKHGSKIVGVGECGLDYYYQYSPKQDQASMLRFQIELALAHDLPLSFHVREAFDDFWSIYDSYTGVRGVLHSFTDNLTNLEKALERGLYIGVNGIATFAKNDKQSVIYRTIPQRSLLLETDAPYLTPVPYRGKVCEPKHVRATAKYLSELRGESLEQLAAVTTANAHKLFRI